MSYGNTRYEYQLMNAADGTSTSTAGRKTVNLRPVYVRRASMNVVVAGTTTPVVVTLKKRITPASDTGGTTIGTLTMPSATSAAGVMVYLDDLNTLISYGNEVYSVVSTAGGGSLTIDVTVELEDAPDNIDRVNADETGITEVTA